MTEEVNLTMTMVGFTAIEESEARRLQRCADELLQHRFAISEIQAKLKEFQARLDALERARNQ